MLPADVLRQVRRLQLKARRAVHGVLGGAYHSAFKGAGISFDEVREYHPGDDIRRIDWNVTARAGHPFVKRYVEERELTVLLAVDLSASQRFGTGPRAKRQVAAELAALLTVSAVGNGDRVGLAGFTNTVERYVPPAKGARHALRVLRDVLAFEPAGRGTDLGAALDFLGTVRRKRAVVFLFSDFLDAGFEPAFRRTARRHDLIAVRISDPRELEWPAAGLVQLEDAETGRQLLVDTGDPGFRAAFAARAAERRKAFDRLARSAGVDVIDADTGGDHADALVRFFRLRETRRRHG
jgi:uncharacterized protein (DUF58 family)